MATLLSPSTPGGSKYFSSHFRERILRGQGIALLVLAVSLGVTFLMWQKEQQASINFLQLDFDFRVRDINTRIEQRMKAYEQMMRSAQGAFAAQRPMGRKAFHDFVTTLNLQQNFPGVKNLGFELIVPAAQKLRHLSAMRSEGVTGYAINPEGVREFYAPAIYIAPLSATNREELGFDDATDPLRRSAMERSRDSDMPIISANTNQARFSAEIIQRESADFRMYLPIFKNDQPHGTVESRRVNIIGWVVSRFQMDELMNGLLGESATEIDIDIHDGEIMSNQSMLYDPDLSGDTGWSTALCRTLSHIEIAGHHWTVAIRSLNAFESRLDRTKTNVVLLAGIGTSVLLALLTGVLVWGRERALEAAALVNRELAERKRAEENLRLAATVIRTMEEGVLVTDPNNIIISVNPAFTAITGYTASEVIGKNPSMLSAGKHPPEFYKAMWQTLLEKGTWHGEIWERRKNGELFLKWLSIRVVRDEKGKLIHYMAVFSEISERKFAEERMQFQAHYDALTGLPNRIACADRLQQSLLQAKREQSRMAFMLLDLDKLKPLNESFGYDIGDVLIKEVAFRLQQCLNESETAARLGSDEFAVLVPRIETEYDARQIADKILHVLHQPYVLDGQRLHLYVSIGVVVYPEHGESEQQLVKNADIALGYAKGNAAEKVKIYHPGMKEMSEYMASAPTIWSLFFDIVSRNQPGRNNSGKTRLRLIRNSAQRDAEIQVLS